MALHDYDHRPFGIARNQKCEEASHGFAFEELADWPLVSTRKGIDKRWCLEDMECCLILFDCLHRRYVNESFHLTPASFGSLNSIF